MQNDNQGWLSFFFRANRSKMEIMKVYTKVV